MGSTLATQRCKLRHRRIKAQDFLLFGGGGIRYYGRGILLDCGFLHNGFRDFDDVCGWFSGTTPATGRYKAHSYAVNNHEVNTLTRRDTRRNTWRSHREAMSELPPEFSRIRNSIENYLNGLYEYKIYCDPGQKAKGRLLTSFQSQP